LHNEENDPGMRGVAVAVLEYRMSGEWFQQRLPEIVLDAVEGF